MLHNTVIINNKPINLNPEFKSLSLDNQIIFIMNAISKDNVDFWINEVRSNFDIDEILSKIIVKAIAVSGSPAIAHYITIFINKIYSMNHNIVDSLFDFDIRNCTIAESRRFWYLFWALYFVGSIPLIETLRLYIHMVEDSQNNDKKVECIKIFVQSHLFNITEQYDDTKQFQEMKLEIYNLGIEYYESFNESILHYQLFDSLEAIDQKQFYIYRQTHFAIH